MAFDDVKEQNIGFEDPVRISVAKHLFKLRRNSIDPATALPITYRTMSMDIDEPRDKK
ncbi:hypothetical protein V1504DRAFT_433557 [Lipomyces starkeyi]